MSIWPRKKLGTLTTKIGSGATPRGGNATYVGSGISFIRSQNVLDHEMKLADIAHITDEAAHKLRGVTVEADDVLINITGDSIARCCVVDTAVLPARVNQHVAILRTTSELDARFLQKFLVTPTSKELLIGISSGGTRKALTRSDLSNLDIPTPPLEVQRAIAEVLGALDDKIAANTKFAVTVDSFLAALFQKLTQDASTLPLGDVATVNPATSKPVPGGSLRYIDISSVGQGTFDFPDISAWDDAPSRARRHVQRGDTLWSTVRPNRRSHALVLSDDDLLVGSTGLAILRPGKVGFAYLYEATKTTEFTAYLENVAEGSAYPAVRANRFVDAPIKWVTAPERESFETIAAPLRQTVQSLTEENLTLTATRDALLPQLMSGKLRVKEAEKVLENTL